MAAYLGQRRLRSGLEERLKCASMRVENDEPEYGHESSDGETVGLQEDMEAKDIHNHRADQGESQGDVAVDQEQYCG